jgi:uncharacterized protein YkwD
MRTVLLIATLSSLLAINARAAEPADTAGELAGLVNGYRQANGLSPIPISRQLTLVARTHAHDLATQHPDRGTDSRGMACNMHSWSSAGAWTPVCYTADHHYSDKMWSKPREVTRGAYPGYGYEIAHGRFGAPIDAAGALRGWQSSPAHNAVILEQDKWKPGWLAMGLGVEGGYAVIWFGREADPTR